MRLGKERAGSNRAADGASQDSSGSDRVGRLDLGPCGDSHAVPGYVRPVTGTSEPVSEPEYDPEYTARVTDAIYRAQARKSVPIWRGVLMYFPRVWAEVAKVSFLGNQQHNPGQPLHWSRGKSDDHLDSAMRHLLDYGQGARADTDGALHLAKAIWRLCAQLQIDLEQGAGIEPLIFTDHAYFDNLHDKTGLR